MEFVLIAIVFGLATGAIGAMKGSSFPIWFLVGLALPGVGIIAALFMRREREEPRRTCPECGNVLPLSDQVCMRCGHDLDFPDEVAAAR
ncbi:MAG: zinc ribbon domain-containing protein [Thermoleophilaceae bacterium]|nr:zinc ribbon domain-containing protein [Thermoleophilaceae bacterium]